MPLPINLENWLQSVAKIKLSGGVVGRVCQVVMVVAVCFVALGVFSGNPRVMAGGIAAVFLFAFPMLWRALTFAERNPYAALLDGAELLLHQQMMLGTKTQPTLPSTEIVVEEGELPEEARGEVSAGQPQPQLPGQVGARAADQAED